MGLESVTHISDLNTSNPTVSDGLSEGDDHIRNIKTALKNDFAGITGAVTATQTELNVLDGITSTTAELNILDGVTSTTAELNLLDGVTSTTAELNILDGVTSTTAEINTLDGVTSTSTEINLLAGKTALFDEVSSTMDTDGRVEFSNGLILLWGRFTSSGDGTQVVTYHTAFPTACLMVQTGGLAAGQTVSFTAANFTIDRINEVDLTPTYSYFAIGH